MTAIVESESVCRPPAESPPAWSLIDFYLGQQQELSAVEMFSQQAIEEAVPSRVRRYSALLPAAPPRPGEQYAFEVDLDNCSGCKACVTACHTLNGLDEHESWRDVGMLHGGTDELPMLQHVTSACHHCLDPACLNVCPVRAYEKDVVTGIVRHLDDQCFGCQYCILACPYDVPKYNKQRGIVRKCDMCSQRLAVNEPPACVQACPHEAIRITVVNQAHVIADCETNLFLPGAPEPHYTLPTTNFKSRKPLPRNLLPADYYVVRPEHAHWPLILMLVLTQLSVGAFLVELLLDRAFGTTRGVGHIPAVSALVFGLLALAASTCHLGRPLYAFRAVIGLRTSWLSREILAFGVFAGLATAYATCVWFEPVPQSPAASALRMGLGTAVVVCGLCGIVCSIMIYQCTRRALWNGTATTLKFLLTTAMLGIVASLIASLAGAAWSPTLTVGQLLRDYGLHLCRALIVVVAAKLVIELAIFRHLTARQNSPLKRSAGLLIGPLLQVTQARFAVGVTAGLIVPGLVLAATDATSGPGAAMLAVAAGLMFAGCLLGEMLERYLFFTAVVAPRMPGGLSA